MLAASEWVSSAGLMQLNFAVSRSGVSQVAWPGLMRLVGETTRERGGKPSLASSRNEKCESANPTRLLHIFRLWYYRVDGERKSLATQDGTEILS